MNEDTGELTLITTLDYNTQFEYTLTILATDQALVVLERRVGSFVLTINVNDVNSDPPVLDPIGDQRLEENLPSGSIVFTVSATDPDKGLTVPLSFSITVLLQRDVLYVVLHCTIKILLLRKNHRFEQYYMLIPNCKLVKLLIFRNNFYRI